MRNILTTLTQLELAFFDLADESILLEAGVAPNQVEGCYRMMELTWRWRSRGDEARGYVFYDREQRLLRRAREPFFLNYGLIPTKEMTEDEFAEAKRAVGEIVCRVMRDRGVEVEWDGDVTKRIRVMRWM
jgi:hypothetical protein